MNKALIIVDPQRGFCPGGSLAVPGGDSIFTNVNKLIDHAEKHEWLIVATRDWHPATSKHFIENGGKWPTHCIADTPDAEFHPLLKLPSYVHIVSKGMHENEDGYSGFDGFDEYGVNLHTLLRNHSIDEVYITGLATDYCVRATAIDAVRNHYITYVVEDAIKAVNLKPHDGSNALAEMKEKGAEIRETDDVLYIINSLLDTDFYKLTMGQFIFNRYPDVPVKFSFMNRTKSVRLADIISEEDLRRELDHVKTLRLRPNERRYLEGIKKYAERMFSESFLDFFQKMVLPDYTLSKKDGQFNLDFEGAWSSSTYWELYGLPIISELYNRARLKQMTSEERESIRHTGKQKLAEKIQQIKDFHTPLNFTDFGTRRRFSREWQGYVNRTLAAHFTYKVFKGTSNVLFAMMYNLQPTGTCAHELPMVATGIYRSSDADIRDSHSRIFEEWYEEYGYALAVNLPDTFGSKHVFESMTADDARKWKGFRVDSKDPIKFGQDMIHFYEKHGIRYRGEKLLIPSDGLELKQMKEIANHFENNLIVSFGWGSNLTNDCGVNNLSIVIKPTMANGHHVVKLSDNVAKATGDPDTIEQMKEIFNYDETFSEECRY